MNQKQATIGLIFLIATLSFAGAWGIAMAHDGAGKCILPFVSAEQCPLTMTAQALAVHHITGLQAVLVAVVGLGLLLFFSTTYARRIVKERNAEYASPSVATSLPCHVVVEREYSANRRLLLSLRRYNRDPGNFCWARVYS